MFLIHCEDNGTIGEKPGRQRKEENPFVAFWLCLLGMCEHPWTRLSCVMSGLGPHRTTSPGWCPDHCSPHAPLRHSAPWPTPRLPLLNNPTVEASPIGPNSWPSLEMRTLTAE